MIDREALTDEELARTLENTASLLNAGIPTLPENEHLVDRYMEAARRLRSPSDRGGDGPRAKDMIDHIDDIGRRLASGELDPKDAGGSLRYIAGKLDTLRASTDAPSEERTCPRCGETGVGAHTCRAPTDEAPEWEDVDWPESEVRDHTADELLHALFSEVSSTDYRDAALGELRRRLRQPEPTREGEGDLQ